MKCVCAWIVKRVTHVLIGRTRHKNVHQKPFGTRENVEKMLLLFEHNCVKQFVFKLSHIVASYMSTTRKVFSQKDDTKAYTRAGIHTQPPSRFP